MSLSLRTVRVLVTRHFLFLLCLLLTLHDILFFNPCFLCFSVSVCHILVLCIISVLSYRWCATEMQSISSIALVAILYICEQDYIIHDCTIPLISMQHLMLKIWHICVHSYIILFGVLDSILFGRLWIRTMNGRALQQRRIWLGDSPRLPRPCRIIRHEHAREPILCRGSRRAALATAKRGGWEKD